MIQVTGKTITGVVDYRGGSDEEKPTESVAPGSTFYEWDTGDLYMFNGTTWVKPA